MSQVIVLLVAFGVGTVAGIFWVKGSLEASMKNLEARVVNVSADSITKRKVIEAEAFVLRDGTGKARIELRNGEQVFYDENVMGRTGLKSGTVRMHYADGEPIANLSAPGPGKPGTFALVRKDKTAVFFVATETNNPALSGVLISNSLNLKGTLEIAGSVSPRVTL